MGRGWTVAAIAALALALAGCGSSNKQGSGTATPAQTSAANSAATEAAGPNTLKIGVLTTCGGPFALFEAESFSGAKYALVKDAGGKATGTAPQDQVTGAKIAGRPVQLSFGC